MHVKGISIKIRVLNNVAWIYLEYGKNPKEINTQLTGVDPSKHALALVKDKFPAKNEPPFWKAF